MVRRRIVAYVAVVCLFTGGGAAYALTSGRLPGTREPARDVIGVELPVSEWCWPDEPLVCVEYLTGVGDTLAAIARRYYPDIDSQTVMWAIRRANEADVPAGLELEPGQRLLIPDPSMYGVGRPKAGQ